MMNLFFGMLTLMSVAFGGSQKGRAFLDLPFFVSDSRLEIRGEFQDVEVDFYNLNVYKLSPLGEPKGRILLPYTGKPHETLNGKIQPQTVYLNLGPGTYSVELRGTYTDQYGRLIDVETLSHVRNTDPRDMTYLVPSLEFSVPPFFQSVVAEIQRETSDPYEQALAIHDWVAENVYYNFSGQPVTGATQGLQPWQIQVCIGYAELFMSLARMAGIPTKMVMGESPGTTTHYWNEIFLNGKWRYVDPTWDSGNQFYADHVVKKPVSRSYFDPPKDIFEKKHKKTRQADP